MPHVKRSIILDAPTDAVWDVIRDFNGHDHWHPAVASSQIERGQPADRVGCVRNFRLAGGENLREQLLTLSDLEQSFSYCLLDTPVPLFNYVAHCRLTPVTDGDRTFWEWESRFDTPAGRSGELAGMVGDDIYTAGFHAVARHMGLGQGWRMPEVVTFASAAEAAGALGAGAHLLGGGTLLMRAVNYGDRSIQRIVRTTDPSMTAIRSEGGRIVIGASVTMSGIIAARETDFLAHVARAIGGPAVRNMATIGGNLFAAHPYGDFAVALLALEATVRTTTGETPLEQFLTNRTGLVTAITVPRPPGDAFRFRKVSRVKPKGVSVMSMAAVLNRSAGRLSGVRVAYGAMASTPVRVPAVERALEGASLDRNGIAAALAAATEGLDPPEDSLASGWYRREVAPVHLRRLLLGEDP